MRRRLSPFVLRILSLCAPLAACGGSTPPPPATHADFDAIQRQEARLDQALHDADAPEGTDRCEAARVAEEARDRICTIADRVTDADADTRCADASRAALHVRSRCDNTTN